MEWSKVMSWNNLFWPKKFKFNTKTKPIDKIKVAWGTVSDSLISSSSILLNRATYKILSLGTKPTGIGLITKTEKFLERGWRKQTFIMLQAMWNLNSHSGLKMLKLLLLDKLWIVGYQLVECITEKDQIPAWRGAALTYKLLLKTKRLVKHVILEPLKMQTNTFECLIQIRKN